ncbi:MAG TPA: preprotein translocase subunit SecE [Leptolyngbyaceae cyanobacterium M65_K2018_010]|nr:preprotein translocase subunit SecE [Leptolyngbyaceae cyanobacterium M65_K2018_010]
MVWGRRYPFLECSPAGAKPVVKKDSLTESKLKGGSAPEPNGRFSVGEFLQGTKEELNKVVWPSRQQLISESAAVILMVSLSATLIYLVDQLFGWVSRQVF